ncbi:nucleotidyltransferase domain-containing protein [candidate division KSB1 bacterium]|nr:nucleotidyltransferase domain-containing protein [candidate division KSB1 bacterium]
MIRTISKNEITSIINQNFKNDEIIAAIYLFGSQASGKTHSRSDIDIAILFNKCLPKIEAHYRLETYFTKLSRALEADPDIVDMEHVNLILLFEILHDGVIILENNQDRNRVFQAQKIIECIDFQVIAKRCAHGMYKNTMERLRGKDYSTVSKN